MRRGETSSESLLGTTSTVTETVKRAAETVAERLAERMRGDEL